MNKETFIALMAEQEWSFLGKPDTSKMAAPAGQNTNWEMIGSQNQFMRGNCIIHVTDPEIEELIEDMFNGWFDAKSGVYYFTDDWKKKFKGSEFLIPVVEKEMHIRKRLLMQDEVWKKLYGVQTCRYTIEEVLAEVETFLKGE